VVTIMTAENCTAGINGSFCGQVHFFASHEAAEQWVNGRPHFAIVTVDEAYQLAKQLYIEPMLKAAS
ncbi:MAG: alkylmercury lyase, partial [Chloroflexi bacterium]